MSSDGRTPAPGEISCRDFVELVTDYLDDALPNVLIHRFEEHLSHCPGCSGYLTQMRQTLSALGRLDEDDIPEEGRDALLAAFNAWTRRVD